MQNYVACLSQPSDRDLTAQTTTNLRPQIERPMPSAPLIFLKGTENPLLKPVSGV
jgi:hypothetical protein